jgi:hypothetical protein
MDFVFKKMVKTFLFIEAALHISTFNNDFVFSILPF